jgi:hypothetical protein
MAELRGEVGGGFSGVVVEGWIGVVSEEKIDQIEASGTGGSVERSETGLLAGVDVSTAIEKQAHDLGIAAGYGGVEWRYFEGVGGNLVYVGAGIEEVFDQFGVSEESGETEWVEAVGRIGVERSGEAFDQDADTVFIANGAGIEDIEDAAALHKDVRDGGLAEVAGEGDHGNALLGPGGEEIGIFGDQVADLGFVALLNG